MAEFDLSTLKPASSQSNAGKDPAGFDIDLDRPMLSNPDGSFSTERTITVQGRELGLDDDRWYNIPSIVGGREVSQEEASRDAKTQLDQGWVFPNFDDEPEASRQAPLRSNRIDELRQPGRDMGQERTQDGFDLSTLRARPVDTDEDNRSGWAIQTMKTGAAGIGQMVLNTAKFIWETPSGASRYSKAASEAWQSTGLPVWTDPFAFPAEMFRIVDEGVDIGDYHAAGTGDMAERIGGAIEILPEISPTFARLGVKSEEAALATAALLEGRTDLLKGVATDPEAWAGFIGNALPTLFMAWKSGGSLSFIGWLEAMDAAENVAQYEEMTGEKISHGQFVLSTAAVGAANAFLERAGLDAILGKFSKGAGGVIGGFVVGATTEGGTELLQEITQNVAGLGYDEDLREQATEAIEEGEWLPFLTSMTEGALPALMGGAGLGGPAGSLGANANSMAERHGAIQDKETSRRGGLRSLLPDLGGREHYTEEEVKELGLEKVEITQELLERVASGDPLNDNEQYTLTNDEDRLGRFIGEAGSERIMLLANGMEQLQTLQREAAPDQIEDITMEGEEITIEQRFDLETLKKAESPRETFVADTTKTKEPRKSIRARLLRAMQRTDTQPSDAQIEAGNYKKGHLNVQSLPISIENPKGSTRKGTDRTGRKWSTKLKDSYGYITGTKGKDKDHLDVFVGQYPGSDTVVVINQKKNAFDDLSEENFDEHKVMVGYRTSAEAVKAYNRNYTDGGALKGSAILMTMEEFKDWTKNSDTTKIAERRADSVMKKFPKATIETVEEEGDTIYVSGLAPEMFGQPGSPQDRAAIRALRAHADQVGKKLHIELPDADGKPLGQSTRRKRIRFYEEMGFRVETRSNYERRFNRKATVIALSDPRSVRPDVKLYPRPLRLRKTNDGKGMSVAKVQDAVRPFYRMFRTAPSVRVVEAIEDLPPDIVFQLKSNGDEGVTNGVYVQDALTDTVYLVANNTSNSQEAIETLIHEIIGHYGIHQVVPPAVFADVMDKVVKSFPKEVRDSAVRNGLDFTDPMERRIAAEEFIAYMSQRMVRHESVPAKVKQYIKELVQAIRNRLRAAFGRDSLYTDEQIWSMLGQSADYVQKAGGLKRDQQRGLLRHIQVPVYYSQMFNVINAGTEKNMSPEKWKDLIKMHIKKGRIKQVEVDWMGIEAWLEDVTWNDVSKMTGRDMDVLPREVQEWTERKQAAEAVVARSENADRVAVAQLGAYEQQVEIPSDEEVTKARAEIDSLRLGLQALGEKTPPKIPKEVILRYIQTEGTQVDVMEPGGDPQDAPAFDEDSPDEEEGPDEDAFGESDEWQQTRESHIDAYTAEALKEVHEEHNWDDDAEPDESNWKHVTFAAAEEIEVEDMDLEQVNQAQGWDDTSQDDMVEDADERATEALEGDHWDDAKDDWIKKNTSKKWYSGNMYVYTDSDGDFIIEDTESGSSVGGSYYTSMDDVNLAIEEHYQESGSQRWHEYVLPGGREYTNLLFKWENVDNEYIFQETGHWPDDDWNYFAHARYDIRTDLNGDDAILVDEFQSDWHQETRDRFEELLSEIHDEHNYERDWWKQTGAPFGGEKYDGYPLEQMKAEARDQAFTQPGKEAEARAAYEEFFRSTYEGVMGIKARVKKEMKAWDLPYDNEILASISGQASGTWADQGRQLINMHLINGHDRIQDQWNQFDNAGARWKVEELYRSHGWVPPSEQEGVEALDPSVRRSKTELDPAFGNWHKTKEWDGTEHQAIMKEGVDWMRSLREWPSTREGQPDPMRGPGEKILKIAHSEANQKINRAQITVWDKANDEGWQDIESWPDFIDRYFEPTASYITDESVLHGEMFDALANAVARRQKRKVPDAPELREDISKFNLTFKELQSEKERAGKAVVLAPFESTWQTVAMKMMIREAVQRGHKRIFFQQGDVHGIRWGGGQQVTEVLFWKGVTEHPTGVTDDKTPDLFTGEIRVAKDRKKPIEWIVVESPDTGRVKVVRSQLHTIVGREAAQKILSMPEEDGKITNADVDNPIYWATSDRLSGGREVYNSITVYQFNKFLKPFKAKVKLGAFKPEGNLEDYVGAGATVRDVPYKSQHDGSYVDKAIPIEVEGLIENGMMGVVITDLGMKSRMDAETIDIPEGPESDELYEKVRTEIMESPGEVKEAGIAELKKRDVYIVRAKGGKPVMGGANNLEREKVQDYLDKTRAQERAENFAVEAWEIELTPKLIEAVNTTGFQLFSKKPQMQIPATTDTANFKRWFGDSLVVDENGEPLGVYHGTTHDFSVFKDGKLANPENHFGRAHYFTDSPIDVSVNYAGEGPDLTQRIELASERFSQDDSYADELSDIAGKDYDEMDSQEVNDAAKELAKRELSGGTPNVMPVYLKMENPADLIDGRVTYEIDMDYYRDLAADELDKIDYRDSWGKLEEERYAEDLDEKANTFFYEDMHPQTIGNGQALMDALVSVAYRFDDIDGGMVRQELMEHYGEIDGVPLGEFLERIRSSEHAIYATDDEGALAVGDYIRVALEEAGYDGIIMDADTAFGTQREYGKAMEMDYGTKHYIVFDPAHIKSSIGNRGTFDPQSPDIRFSKQLISNEQARETFQIIDKHTGEQVGKNYQGKNAHNRARNRVDKLDNEYGAYRYGLRDLTGSVRFSKKIRTGKPNIDQALASLEKKVGPSQLGGIKRIQARAREVMGIMNKGRKFEQAIVDQFAGIKWAIREAYGGDLPAEMSGYKQAHFTTSGDSQMYAFLMHGIPVWTNGITQIKEGSKGLLEILEPVANHIDEWGRYMAAIRAGRLLKEDREHLITQEEVDAMEELGELMPEFKTVAADFAVWKGEFLDWAQEAGVINKDTRPLWDHADYVPFFRIKADELGGSFDKRAGQGVAGIANQINPIKRLKGGTDPIGNILENILINFSHIASTAMKNHATRLTLENLEGTGLVEPVRGSQFMQQEVIAEADLLKKLKAAGVDPASMPTTALNAMRKMWTIQVPQADNVISVLINGKKKYYNVHEETLLRSLNAINIEKFNSLAARLGMWLPRKAKRLLTSMITLDPGFMVANWFRDLAMAFTNSRHSKFPRPDAAFIGALKARAQSKEMVSIMAAGGAFYQGYVNAMDPVATSKALKRAMRKKQSFRHHVLDAPWKFVELYLDLGAAAENANRIAQGYIPAIKAGAGTAEAVWESKDLMNFAKHGDNGAMQFLIQTVPFLNARIQGLVRWGQRFKEAPGITFSKSFMYTLAVMAIYLSNKDDDRYKELPEEEKDMYIHFWLNGKHWRLPKAFEVGMIFGTGPERLWEYWESNEDDAGKLALDRLKFVIDEVFMMIDPTTIIPMPQLIKPFYEASTNWNGFFQSTIVPEYLSDIAETKPDMIYRASTSPAMRELAAAMPRFMPHTLRNPMMLQHLMRGYFGTLGAHAMLLTDDLVRNRFDYPPRPALRWSAIPAIGRFYRGEDQPSRTNFEETVYELRNNARGIERTIAQMKREELDDEIEAFQAEPSNYNRRYSNQEILDSSVAMNSNMSQVRRLRTELNEIWMNENMSPQQKLTEVNRIYREKAEEFSDAYRERPGSSEPTAKVTVETRVGTLALLDDLDGRDQQQTIAYLEEQGLVDLAALVRELPGRPRRAFSDLMGISK